MRFRLVVKAPQARAHAVRAFEAELVRAGVLLASDGLDVEPVDGHWIIQARSREEAMEWARRAPFERGELLLEPLLDGVRATGR